MTQGPCRTSACRRPLTASAPASLPLPAAPEAWRSPGRCASGRTWQLSRELLPAATRRENQELKTDAPSGHGLAAALARAYRNTDMRDGSVERGASVAGM